MGGASCLPRVQEFGRMGDAKCQANQNNEWWARIPNLDIAIISRATQSTRWDLVFLN